MRRAFIATLVDLGAADPRIVLLTGDLGFHAIEPFADRFPDRFFNAGVAEQNMVGVATGLAEAGFVPFVYSIVPFAVLRPLEFIRNGAVHHRFPVRIVGIGGGFEYAHLGNSHYALEDVGVLRMQPGLTVIAPADYAQAAAALRATVDLPGPVYYRLGKDDTSLVDGLEGAFDASRVARVGNGRDLLILSMGSIGVEMSGAVADLLQHAIDASLGIVAAFTPGAAQDLADLLAQFETVITVEAHYAAGGLGAWVSEIAADRNIRVRLLRHAVRDSLYGCSGGAAFMHEQHGISRGAIVKAAFAALRGA